MTVLNCILWLNLNSKWRCVDRSTCNIKLLDYGRIPAAAETYTQTDKVTPLSINAPNIARSDRRSLRLQNIRPVRIKRGECRSMCSNIISVTTNNNKRPNKNMLTTESAKQQTTTSRLPVLQTRTDLLASGLHSDRIINGVLVALLGDNVELECYP